jgi:protein-tyrosine phosphatase
MDESNYSNIISLTEDVEHREKVKLILSYLHPVQVLSVPDPWYGDQNGFEQVYQMLNEACEMVIKTHFK